MDKQKIIILALVVIVVILLVAVFSMMPGFTKQNTEITFKNNSTLTKGDSLNITLTDANGTALADQTVNITIADGNNTENYHSAVTDENGTASLKLDNGAGNYTVTVSYAGDEKYNGCNSTEEITIEEEVVETQTSSSSSVSSSSSTSSSSNYDSGAFYSKQSESMVYTGEVRDAPDGHKWRHLGNNEWERVD